jgi:hypothetical protein
MNRSQFMEYADILNQMALYDLAEKGRFKRIRIVPHRHLDPESVKHK